MTDETQNNEGYEKQDINPLKVIAWGVGGVVFITIALVVLYQLFFILKDKEYDDVVLKPRSADLRELRAHEVEALNSYGVIDSTDGVYQIPIDRAINLMAEEAYRKSKGKPAQGRFIR